MSKLTKKENRQIPVRIAGETIVKFDDRPSKVLFDKYIAEAKAESNIAPPTTPIYPLPPPTTKNFDVSPKRDYTKVANSINRDAVPSGLFKGTSKNTYDVLYQRTRGAITPKRSIKVVQSDLLVWTNLSHNSLRSHLKHLQSVGLVRVHYKLGDNSGAEYEVLLPEEVNLEVDNQPASYHPLPLPTTNQNVVEGSYQNTVVGGGSLMPVNVEGNQPSKTSFKDNTKNDDEAARIGDGFLLMAKRLDEAAKKLTGKGVSKTEAEKWGTLAELLILELEAAAKKTDSISSVPAFLTEVLRRQFFASRRQSLSDKPSKTKPDTVGKTDQTGEYEIKALDREDREAALEYLFEWAEDDEFLHSYKRWYTPDDWEWLIKALKMKPEKQPEPEKRGD